MKYTTRLGVTFTLFISMFSILTLRLWFVQVAEGAQAAELAQRQSILEVEVPAPRGDIFDANGVLLASSRYVPAIWVDRHFVDPEEKEGLVQALSTLLNIPAADISLMYEEAGPNGRFQVAVIDTAMAYRVAEQLRDYPGVSVERIPERVYLSGDSLAHVIGHLGKPTREDLVADPSLDPNVRIGKLGVERVYQEYLAGEPGLVTYRLDLGEIANVERSTPVAPGMRLYLTIDSELQTVVRQALIDGIANANQIKEGLRAQGETDGTRHEVTRGAVVVLDVRTGAVLALESLPSFDPGLFVGGLDVETFSRLQDEGAFLNLATSGQYPPASTFKVVTYTALLENDIPFPTKAEGVDAANRVVHCDGEFFYGFQDGSRKGLKDWYGNRDLGWLNYHEALTKSCNIYFYAVAAGVWENWANTSRENVIQDLARSLGFGSETGIDLSTEAVGLIPDRALFEERKKFMLENEDAPQLLDQARLEARSPWFGGDLLNLAIGQGETLSTPIQLATAYAALVNGGTVYQPHVVGRIYDNDGNLAYAAAPTVVNTIPLADSTVEQLLTDLNRVVTVGTAQQAFAGFGDSLDQVGGKTGTGQSIATKDNHAWFAGVAPIDDPRYVVVVLLDEGGSGGGAAAPVARYIMQYLMGEELDPIKAGQLAD